MTDLNTVAVENFQKYLQIETVQPNPDYEGCCKFLFEYGTALGLKCARYEPKAGYPFVVMTLEGSQPTLSTIVCYSHTDVVPVAEANWKFPPFSGHKDTNGDIYARGAQDMKCVGIQYVEALRKLFSKGVKQFQRTIHIVWGPDEEIGGENGMKLFVETDEFRALNIGFVLDEGLASESDKYLVYYAERCPWWFKAKFPGNPGHGSKFVENTAVEKLHKFMSSALAFRAQEKAKMESNVNFNLGDVTSLNVTILEGGKQVNVLPELVACSVDMRIPPTYDFEDIEKMINKWAAEAGEGVEIEFLVKTCIKHMTPTTDEDPFWKAFAETLKEESCEFTKQIFTGATDSRFLREKGYKSIGFSPMNNTPSLLHDHNEYLNEKVFLRGIEIYEKLISNLANVA